MLYNEKHYTLITGGSSGIGRALAFECAARKMNLLLVALPGKELALTGKAIMKKHQVTVHTFETDLRKPESPEQVYKWCRENHFRVNMLINNAGVAGTSVFEESSIEYNDDRIQLNIRALVTLSHLFIPHMKTLPEAFILNVASLSAFYAIPYKSIYSASKAFVVSFSKSIREELRNTPVQVSVVCPNGVGTNQGTHTRIKAHGYKGRVTQISPENLARLSIKETLKGKRVIIPGRINRGLFILGNLIPGSIKQRLLAREFRKELKTRINGDRKKNLNDITTKVYSNQSL